MPKTQSLAALAAAALLLGSGLAAQADTTQPSVVVTPGHQFTTAERNQLAMEAGISPQQAQSLTLGQLAWLKAHRDDNDGAYFGPPAHVEPGSVHS